MWNIGTVCATSYVKEALTKQVIKISKIEVKNFPNRAKRSLSDPLPEADARSRFADQVGSAIAKVLKWNTDVMDWLAYSENVTQAVDPDISNIIIMLADLKALGIVNSSMPGINFNQTIEEFASAVAKGALPLLQVDGHNVWVKSLASCSDKSCNRHPGTGRFRQTSRMEQEICSFRL